MMMKHTFLIGMAVMLLTACTDPKQEVVNGLRSEAIQLHDEVMPRMGEMVELQGDLKQIREALVIDSTDTLGTARLVYTEQIAALEAAHEAMMDWMANYDPTYDATNPLDSAVVYYEHQRAMIMEVKQAMEQSIENAKQLKDEALR